MEGEKGKSVLKWAKRWHYHLEIINESIKKFAKMVQIEKNEKKIYKVVRNFTKMSLKYFRNYLNTSKLKC